jgi:hypothetical protein
MNFVRQTQMKFAMEAYNPSMQAAYDRVPPERERTLFQKV